MTLYKELNEQLLADNKKGVDRIEELAEIVKGYQERSLDGLYRFLHDFFEDTDIENYIVHITSGGNLTIKVGSDDNWEHVDIERFQENPIGALEEVKMRWANNYEEN